MWSSLPLRERIVLLVRLKDETAVSYHCGDLNCLVPALWKAATNSNNPDDMSCQLIVLAGEAQGLVELVELII
jgi:hypothetical protein